VKLVGATDIGLHRRENQDAVMLKQLKGAVFAAVCDGMGGGNSGKKAAITAIITAAETVSEEYDARLSHDEIKKLLTTGIDKANTEIFNQARKNPRDYGMGTTCTAALVQDETLHVVNAGDSRAYLYSDGKLVQLTVDHTYVQMLYIRGEIQQHEIAMHPKRNLLTKAVGVESSITSDYFRFKLPQDWLLLLCSDGLSGFCSFDEIKAILDENKIDAAYGKLIDSANANGGRDNISVALISSD